MNYGSWVPLLPIVVFFAGVIGLILRENRKYKQRGGGNRPPPQPLEPDKTGTKEKNREGDGA